MNSLAHSSNIIKNDEQLITHGQNTDLDLTVYERNLRSKEGLTLPLTDSTQLLKELSEFEFGRFLLKHKGINGYWTSYMIIHGPKNDQLTPLEWWMLHKSPAIKATQERFQIFRNKLQDYIKDNMTIASVPCGLMDDLFGLDYSGISNIKIMGIDLDQDSLDQAKDNAKNYQDVDFTLIKEDAWNLSANESYDIITSNGLNIYQPDDQKVIELYKTFYQALKPNGVLITSFLTPSPNFSKDSSWKDYNSDDVLKQKAIFADIIQTTFQNYRTEEQTREQLQKAGFNDIEVIYDSQGMFPTVIAKKL